MKHFLLLFASSLCFIQLSFAQVTGFAITNIEIPSTTVLHSCDSTLTIGFSAVTPNTSSASSFDLPYTIHGNNFNGFQFQAQVNWGDGSTTTSGGGTSTSGTNISMNPPLTHYFSSPGTYLVTTTVYNPANQTYAIDTVSYQIGYCSVYLYFMVNLDCNNDGTIDGQLTNVPIVLTNGNTTYTGSTQNGMLYLPSVLAGTYTIQIDPGYLTANNYVVNNQIPNSSIWVGNNGAVTYLATLNCGTAVSQGCLHGHVFCDTNGNGIWDTNETTIANAPVQINGNTFYTNANGEYNLTYVGSNGNSYPISLSSTWAQQFGYTIPSNGPDSVTFTQCIPGTPSPILNFPVNCNGVITNPSNCYGGYVFCDANNNGVFNTGEQALTFAPVQLFVSPNSTTSVTVYTDSTGYFQYCGPFVGTSNVILAQVSPTYLGYNGYLALTTYVTLLGTTTGQTSNGYLPVNCGGTTNGCADLWTTVTPWIGYYQNSTAYIKLNWGSYGPSAVGTYTLSFTYPTGVSPVLSSIQNANYTISGNTITWNLNSSASNFTNYDVIQFTVPGGLINGAQHFYTSTIAPTGAVSDCGTYNNNGSLLQILGNSYDPNDKNASTDYMNESFPLGYLDAFVDDALTYTIRFQNTGSAPAQNVYIIDTLSTLLDWSSFTLIEASHPMQVVNLGNGVLRFEFNQIWLPDSTSNEPESHGHLSYRIQEMPSNALFSIIENTASIYFDWNDAIVTNTTYHQNMWLDGLTETNAVLGVYPNPAWDEIQIDNQEPQMVQIKDVNGKSVFNQEVLPGQKIDIQEFKSGIYIIESKNKHAKFIKN